MTVRFLHIRECDEEGNILNTGGCTIAFTCSKKDIFVQLAFCHPRDQFCKKTGCEVAAAKLKADGPLDFIELNHPVSEAVRLWFMQYYDCCLIHKDKKIWCMDWEPLPEIDFVPDIRDHSSHSEEEIYPETV